MSHTGSQSDHSVAEPEMVQVAAGAELALHRLGGDGPRCCSCMPPASTTG